MKRLGPGSRCHEWKHGYSCYVNHGCRCEVCRSGLAAYMRAYLQKRRRPSRAEPRTKTTTRLRAGGFTWPELVALELLKREDAVLSGEPPKEPSP